MGRPMRWYRPMRREYKARVYHRAHARWSQPRVHESLRYEGPGVRFRGELLHRHDPTLAHVQWKALRYAELKALDWRDRRRGVAPWAWPAVFAGVFLKDYLLRLAILDGARGWAAAYLDAHYTLYKRLRYYDMQQVPEDTPRAAELLGVKEGDRR